MKRETPAAADAVRLRLARLTDVAAILELERHFPSDRMSARSVRGFLSSPRARVWVAENRARQIVGNLVLLTRANSRAARIYSVVVDDAVRGRGIARQLLRLAEHAAKSTGSTAITLEVRADNHAARSLYRKHGYTEARMLPEFYDDGTDGVKLRKTLLP